jgi:hypothetical protein
MVDAGRPSDASVVPYMAAARSSLVTGARGRAATGVNDTADSSRRCVKNSRGHRLTYLAALSLGVPFALLAAMCLMLKQSSAAELSRVGLVVRSGNGLVETRCVAFTESEITGYQVLMSSGLSVVANGGFVCAIGDTGCPADECATCQPPNYWSYWHLVDGTWIYSSVGSTGYMVHDGDVEGWSWGPAVSPTVKTFDLICGPKVYLYLPVTMSNR